MSGVERAGAAGEMNRRTMLGALTAVGIGAAAGAPAVAAPGTTPTWTMEADIVVVGAGAVGLSAAITALDMGSSVIIVEANIDVGGKMLMSGGQVRIGGGNSLQKQNGVEDSEDAVFKDWIDPVDRNSRYSDRDLIHAFARENLATFDFLEANGVVWDKLEGPTQAESVARRAIPKVWPIRSENVVYEDELPGSGIARPLERSARRKGARIIMQHRMTRLVRDGGSNRVTGIEAVPVDKWFAPTGAAIAVRARKGVVIGTGGHSDNVDFRRIFDPRLTAEYQAVGCEVALEGGDGEIQAMAVGASLWGSANQTQEAAVALNKGRIGVRRNYQRGLFTPESKFFFRAKATGLQVRDWQNVILVKENGQRFWDETKGDYDYFAAAMAWTGDTNKLNGGGPIWAIFDTDAVARQEWNTASPWVDRQGFFFQSDTIEGLAAQLEGNEYQWRPMPGATLLATVERFNRFVDTRVDEDFGRRKPKYKIAKPPFFAGWCTPVVHDCYAGLRVDGKARVLDLRGQAIPGLYTGGDTMGGFAMHGLGRAIVFGRIAGRSAASENVS